jgi:hypothetical protein
MNGAGIIKGGIICGVLLTAVFFSAAGNSFGQGLTENIKQKGLDRFIYPDRSEKNDFSQNHLYSFSCPEWFVNAGNKFNYPMTGRQKAISNITSLSKKMLSFYVANTFYVANNFYKSFDFKINRMIPQNDRDFKIKQLKIREDMNFKIMNVGPNQPIK